MSSPKDSPKMTQQNVSFGEALRAVGQGLESLDVENFELEVEGDGYLALGTPRAPSPGAVANRSTQRGMKVTFQNAWHIIAHRISHHKAVDSKSNILRVLFTPEGIRRLECEGETKRSEDSAGIPNPNKISQILRMVGEYIDAKSGRFISACKQQDSISFDYETAAHIRITKNWKLAELHAYWLQLSNQRQERQNIVERELGGDRAKSGTAQYH
jgi:hypothetical protein